MGNLESPVNLHIFGLWEEAGMPTETWGEHANSTRKCPDPAGCQTQDPLAVRQKDTDTNPWGNSANYWATVLPANYTSVNYMTFIIVIMVITDVVFSVLIIITIISSSSI